MDLADSGSPEGIVTLILKHEQALLCPLRLRSSRFSSKVEEIAELKTEGFEGGLITDTNRSRGMVKKGVS